jgi:hypothetical protein
MLTSLLSGDCLTTTFYTSNCRLKIRGIAAARPYSRHGSHKKHLSQYFYVVLYASFARTVQRTPLPSYSIVVCYDSVAYQRAYLQRRFLANDCLCWLHISCLQYIFHNILILSVLQTRYVVLKPTLLLSIPYMCCWKKGGTFHLGLYAEILKSNILKL